VNNLSLNLIWFQTTKGHFGRKDLYLKTFNNLVKHIDLDKFDYKVFSLKVFKNDSEESALILENFKGFNYKFVWENLDPRINDESSYKDYGYYLLTNYLWDISHCYLKLKDSAHSKYCYLVEDDSPEIIYSNNLEFYLSKAIEKLEENPSIFSVHFKREGDILENNTNRSLFLPDNHDYNFQNQVFRTEDMIKVAEKIKENYRDLSDIHTERAVRTAIYMVNPNYKFISFNPSFVHSIHIGIEQPEKLTEYYKLF
jgi:hypothetical protein